MEGSSQGNICRSFPRIHSACLWLLEVDLFQWNKFPISYFPNFLIWQSKYFPRNYLYKMDKVFMHTNMFSRKSREMFRGEALNFCFRFFGLSAWTCYMLRNWIHNFNDNKHSNTWKIIFHLHEWTVTSVSNKNRKKCQVETCKEKKYNLCSVFSIIILFAIYYAPTESYDINMGEKKSHNVCWFVFQAHIFHRDL